MRIRDAAANAALVTAAITFALGVAEIGARLFADRRDPALRATVRPGECGEIVTPDRCTGWWSRPDLKCTLPHEGIEVPVETDAIGLRIPEGGSGKAGARRVAVFGDSVTFGWGVAGKDAYPAVLERDLRDVSVYNMALPGGGPDQSLLSFGCKVHDRPFDVLIVAPLVENIVRTMLSEREGWPKPYFTLEGGRLDLHAAGSARSANGAAPVNSQAEAAEYVHDRMGNSALYQLLLPGIRRIGLSTGVFRPYRAFYEGPSEELLLEILRGFARDARGARVIFAPLPTYHYIEYDIPPDYERVFRRAAEATGGTYVDVLAAFKRLTPGARRETRFRIDQHYNESGHKVVATALLPYVEKALAPR